MLHTRISLKRALAAAGVAATLTTLGAPGVSMAQQACQVNADFAPLVAQVGPTTVGDCVTNEFSGSATGDRFQTTTRGLLILSGAGNWTAFTDGQSTWVFNANGLGSVGVPQQRPGPAA